MATTTTNYGFDIPQSTDLVKDGVTAIATLGQDIDTAMNTARGTKKAGMVLLSNLSFSGVASQSFNDVFSATYDNYLIKYNNFTTVSNGNISLRLRKSGVDNSSSIYTRQADNSDGTTITTSRTTTTAILVLSPSATTTANGFGETSVFSPNNASTCTGFQVSLTYGGASLTKQVNIGVHDLASSADFDGFTLIASTTMTGTVSVYGYNK